MSIELDVLNLMYFCYLELLNMIFFMVFTGFRWKLFLTGYFLSHSHNNYQRKLHTPLEQESSSRLPLVCHRHRVQLIENI